MLNIESKQSLDVIYIDFAKAFDGTQSTTIRVISGVPQGSVLGPILFCIYINDVCDIIVGNTACKLYADDLKLYSFVDIKI